MPTPGERQALLFVAAVAALGIGVRGCRAIRPTSGDGDAKAALAAQIARVDSAIAAGGTRRGTSASAARSDARPEAERARVAEDRRGPRRREASDPRPPDPVATGPVDVDIAGVEELDRLPGIGPALAARIVEDRAARGPFGSLDALQQVRGIGPALAERLRAHVTFSQPPRPPLTEAPVRRRGRHP